MATLKPKTNKRAKQRNRKDLLFKLMLIFISTAIIVWAFPYGGDSIPYFEKNEPWSHNTLIAKQKFNIPVSNEVIKHQQDSVRRQFRPYFKRDKAVKQDVRKGCATQMKAQGVSSSLGNIILACIDTIYENGVVSRKDLDGLKEDGTSVIMVVDNDNVGDSCLTKGLFTPMTAYQFVKDHVTVGDSVLVSIDGLNSILKTNLAKEEKWNESKLKEELDAIPTVQGFKRDGELIIEKGVIVNEKMYQTLNAYYEVIAPEESENNGFDIGIIGRIALVLMINALLVTYLSMYRKDYLEDRKAATLQFGLMIVFCVLAYMMVRFKFMHVFMLPCCMIPIFIRVLFDSRTAFLFHLATTLLISLSLEHQYEFVLLQVVTGLIAIYCLRELTMRSQILHTALLITIAYIFFHYAFQMGISNVEFTNLRPKDCFYFLANGVLLLLTFPMFWIMEKWLGFVSDMTLVELSSMESPLLKMLSEKASGTFQHSYQVAILAANIANRIGAKAFLVRVGALYHDIGKMERPVFFTENQSGLNPHDRLSAEKSAEVIISHVRIGLEYAEMYKLPKSIRDFIQTHHGLGKAQYFLVKHKNEHPGEPVDESKFAYDGPNPQTKEEAILMMADAVEASSRSLTEYTEEKINDLVEKIINNQVDSGFFNECPITLHDINEAKDEFKNSLKSIYHTRVVYPELNQPDSQA